MEKLNFDYVLRTPCELMHCVFLGVVRAMLSFFTFDKTFGVRGSIDLIDNRISLIHTPSCLTRKLRSFKEIKNFKSSELQALFFYFGPYLLDGIWSNETAFNLLFYLASAILKLFVRQASNFVIDQARFEIDTFLIVFRQCDFSIHLSSYNMHCLAHLYDDRKTLGPLCLNNAYGYEDKLQTFKQSFHSSYTRVESLARKIKEEKRVLELSSPVDHTSVRFGKHCGRNYRAHFEMIFRLLNFSTTPVEAQALDMLTFYQSVSQNYLHITNFKGKLSDSFVKIGDQFYRVHVIFSYDLNNFLLCEHISISRNLQINLNNSETSTNHSTLLLNHFIVNNLETSNFFLFQISDVQKQVCFIEFDEILKEKHSAQFAIVEMFN